ncbi:MAG: hydroxymethylbilane synthase [Thermoplasmata archaeon]|nr:hydroxymethylbilane synthase [Thermoplasmata archaeon]
MKDYKIKIGTRGSKLALAQAMEVSKRLNEIGFETEIIEIKSHGDEDHTPLRLSKQFGLFTKRINEELLNEKIDIAVHSMKDIPTEIENGLKIVAVLKRDNYEDFFVSNYNVLNLESGKKVGTSSPRRRSFLKILRPDLEIVDLRGNVETRLKKFESNEVDALILALAGLKRLNLKVPGYVLDPDIFVPQANQGIIAIVSRNDFSFNGKISKINDEKTFDLANVEREFLKEMDAGCHSSVGILARFIGNKILVHVSIVKDIRMDYWSIFKLNELNNEINKFKRWYNGR